jgi:uncharacterized membrane protein
MTDPMPTRQTMLARTERAGAALGYVLLLIAPFTMGFLALVAIGLAWLRRKSEDEVARSHYRHQIKSFIDDVIVLVLSIAAGWGALAGGVAQILGFSGVDLPLGLDASKLGVWTLVLIAVWLVLWLYGFVGLIVGSVRGLTRLAAGRTIGRKRHWA